MASFFEGLPGDAATFEKRTDRYLPRALSDQTGIKLREGRLEIKSRMADPEPGQIAPGLEGITESWIKYGFELADPEALHMDQVWLEVAKERWVTLVDVAPANLQFHPLGEYPGPWVQLEYTRIILANGQWYTFGLEWPAGGATRIPESFFLGLFQGTHLRMGDSMGYPAFLKRIVQKSG